MFHAAELTVQGRLIRGVVRTPDGAGPFPAMVFYHGFTVDKTGTMRLYERFSRACAEAGFVCVRFDFYGLGESEGDFSEMTISQEVEEAEAIYRWTQRLPYVDETRVCIGGHSMGGLVAALTAPQVQPAGLVLWSAALTMFYQAGMRTRTLQGPTEKGWDIGGMELGRRYMEEAATMDFLQMSRGYTGPVFHIHGSEDEQIPVEVVERYRYLYGPSYRATVLQGADHSFSSLAWSRQVYEESIAFMEDAVRGGKDG